MHLVRLYNNGLDEVYEVYLANFEELLALIELVRDSEELQVQSLEHRELYIGLDSFKEMYLGQDKYGKG